MNRMRKTQGIFSSTTQTMFDAATFLAVCKLALLTGGAMTLGYGLGIATNPQKQDMRNLQKEYRVARLNNDISTQRTQLNRQLASAMGKAPAKKTVYGLV